MASGSDDVSEAGVSPLGDDDAFGLVGGGVADEFGDRAEGVHHPHGQCDVGPAGLRLDQIDADFVTGVRTDHQDGGEELAGLGGAGQQESAGQLIGMDQDRGETVLFEIARADPEMPEHVGQFADGALAHAWNAVEDVSRPCPGADTAVRKRSVVPEFPQRSLAAGEGMAPALPTSVTERLGWLTSRSNPSCRSASSMT